MDKAEDRELGLLPPAMFAYAVVRHRHISQNLLGVYRIFNYPCNEKMLDEAKVQGRNGDAETCVVTAVQPLTKSDVEQITRDDGEMLVHLFTGGDWELRRLTFNAAAGCVEATVV